ncbi:hypothetical protein GNF10_03670 [Nostoc sp. UCD121]|uniref:hypothetical protein n=1 Tax=unclassified Nostoc TaxID=2593658 RepID=UPI001623D77E|nr:MULTISPECIES: hypothetical protein [unclassified Nostoc]MBC1223253.1 hypothetical protein [Nostoc sp. UCD120]MBC1275101.1 hypothetical protein [Nostoc sp. UCD121]MBC1297824.1 hypothetical protein [Nostoc sp. UCD122]
MVKQATLQSNKLPTIEDAEFAFDKFNIQNEIKASACRDQVESAIDAARITVPTCIFLDLEELKCFEPVERQYERWGVIFHNSLAIQPSNPAFPAYSGLTVLMGAPKSGFVEATFLRPVNSVSAFVTSSQRLVLSAYDRDRQLLGQTALPGSNLANSDSAISPNTLLSINVNNIYSVTFCAFDGQFTIDNFHFCL